MSPVTLLPPSVSPPTCELSYLDRGRDVNGGRVGTRFSLLSGIRGPNTSPRYPIVYIFVKCGIDHVPLVNHSYSTSIIIVVIVVVIV